MPRKHDNYIVEVMRLRAIFGPGVGLYIGLYVIYTVLDQ
jgi:hypothetical protein